MPTITEVAKSAGVSVATVSRYFNNRDMLSEETYERISKAVKELSYHPNSIGRSLRTTRSNCILVLIPSIENSFLTRVIKGIQNAGNKLGYSILVGITHSLTHFEQRYLNMVGSRVVDGVILVSPTVRTYEFINLNNNFPIIQCCEYCTEEIPYITIDNHNAAFSMVDMLIKSGCKRIGMISSDKSLMSIIERELGYKDALQANNIEFDGSLLINVPLGFTSGFNALEELLAYSPDSIFAVADILALGALKCAIQRGISVPNQLSVAGFDGIQRGRENIPSLTTVFQPGFEMGRQAAITIINLINGTQVDAKNILNYRVIRRESTK